MLKRALQTLFFVLILVALLFLPAGRLDWVMAWVWIATYLVSVVVGTALVGRADRELIEERRQVREGTKLWDRVLTNLFSLVSLPAVLVIAGLDRRFGWSPGVPLAIQILGLAVCLLAGGLVYWAMASNTFFATYVRIQADRGHYAVSGGPYRFVRHPGYVGMMLAAMAMPLVFGSLWALLPAGIGAAIIIARTVLEDRTLHEELAGYREYAQRVRHRLLPGVW
jgi:protein-S-isoprenylcysteine O-methyltransferase Ste14